MTAPDLRDAIRRCDAYVAWSRNQKGDCPPLYAADLAVVVRAADDLITLRRAYRSLARMLRHLSRKDLR